MREAARCAHVRRKFYDLEVAHKSLIAHQASDGGGERAAILYTLIGTAKLNNRDPESYLRAVLACLADHPINRIAELLPWNFQAFTLGTPTGPQ